MGALRKRRNDPASTIESITPWTGVAAIANMACFIILGVLLPWTLTGGLETPAVRSKMTDTCIGYEDRPEAFENNARLADSLFKQCWFNRSSGSNPCGSMDGVSNERPLLEISRVEGCIFPGDICSDYAKPIRLKHSLMPLRQFGINSKSRVLLSHRLTCTPLKIDPFLNVSTTGPEAMLSFFDWNFPHIEDDLDQITNFATMLSSFNGPNRYSNQSSGRMAAFADHLYELHIWPNEHMNRSEAPKRLHPSLRVDDGTVFVIGFRAGKSYYQYPIDDPLFSAHDLYSTDPIAYLPDHEITALGCIEQYQFCLHEQPVWCTPWSGEQDNLSGLSNTLKDKNDYDSERDLLLFHLNIVFTATVQRYLLARRGTQALLASQYRSLEVVRYIDPKEQWIAEVTAWFETAFLQIRYGEFNLLMTDRPPDQIPDEFRNMTEVFRDVCNRIIFLDGNHTNISFIQLLAILACFMLISLVSIRVKILAAAVKIGNFCWKGLQKAGNYCHSAMASIRSWFKDIRWPKPRQHPSRGPRFASFGRRPDEQRLPVELNQYLEGREEVPDARS